MTLITKLIFMERLQKMSDRNLQKIETILQNSVLSYINIKHLDFGQFYASFYIISRRGNKIGRYKN